MRMNMSRRVLMLVAWSCNRCLKLMKSATAHATKANDQPAMNSVRFPIGSGDVHAVQKTTRVGGKRRVALELSTSMLLMAALLYEVAISTKSAMLTASNRRSHGSRERGRRKREVGESFSAKPRSSRPAGLTKTTVGIPNNVNGTQLVVGIIKIWIIHTFNGIYFGYIVFKHIFYT